jgi:hypothetical protein
LPATRRFRLDDVGVYGASFFDDFQRMQVEAAE